MELAVAEHARAEEFEQLLCVVRQTFDLDEVTEPSPSPRASQER